LITPFTASGAIDMPNLKKMLQMHLDQGTDNLCVLGTTGEAQVLSMDERELILKTVVENVKGKIPITVGTGTINPVFVRAQTQQAIDLGADSVLVVTPYYVKPPQRGLIRLFTETADMGLPVILYNVPGRTACDISDETFAILAEHEKIIGVKDATGNLDRLASLKTILGDKEGDFLKFSGDDGTTLDYVLQGGDGCISVTANLVPGIMHKMVQAALKGDTELATKLNEPLMGLHKKLFIESNPIPCKWAAKRMGMIDTGFARLPLDEMDPIHHETIEEALRQAGLI
jgi:4-hydroxy-tetrahydrodipicolinate synthase